MFLPTFIAIHLGVLISGTFIFGKFRHPALKFFGILATWLAGLTLVHAAGQSETTRLLSNATPDELTSEDFISKIPDGPNITVSWLISGWIPILIAFLIIQRLTKNT